MRYYKLRWEGKGEDEATYVAAANIRPEIRNAYEKLLKDRGLWPMEEGVMEVSATYSVTIPEGEECKSELAREGLQVPKEGGGAQADDEQTRALECNTDKGTQKERKYARTAGGLYCVYNCGVVFSFSELYGSEAISQVFCALKSVIEDAVEMDLDVPMCAAYDDACHLQLFLLKRQHLSSSALMLSLMDWVIDRFHFDNHKYVSMRGHLIGNEVTTLC